MSNQVWDHITPSNLLDWQRAAALRTMGQTCRQLLADGYPQDADRLLDAMTARQASWAQHPRF